MTEAPMCGRGMRDEENIGTSHPQLSPNWQLHKSALIFKSTNFILCVSMLCSHIGPCPVCAQGQKRSKEGAGSPETGVTEKWWAII